MKPSDFFLGVTDFFSIVLPGAAMAFIAVFAATHVEIPPDHFLFTLVLLTGTGGWAAFLIASYVFGHVIASLGAHLDPLYDARKALHCNHALLKLADSAVKQFAAAVHHDNDAARTIAPPVPTRFARFIDAVFLWRAWRAKHTRAESEAPRIEKPINAYKLARLTLSDGAPNLFAEVARLEADSKFFRSLVVVAAFAVLACIVECVVDMWLLALDLDNWRRALWGLGYLILVFIVLRIAFARFCELRLKATEVAFQGMLFVHARPGASTPAAAVDEQVIP